MKTKRTQTTKPVKRQAKLLIKLKSWSDFIEEAFQLESHLDKKPKQLLIEFVGSGEIPADTVLLMRSMILKRSAQTRLVTSARSNLVGATVLIWLLGDTRQIREGARMRFRTAGPFQPAGTRTAWNDRCTCDSCEMAEEDYIRVLQAINEFLPVKELAGRPIEVGDLKQFGLIDSKAADQFLATAFRRDKVRREPRRASRPGKPAREAFR